MNLPARATGLPVLFASMLAFAGGCGGVPRDPTAPGATAPTESIPWAGYDPPSVSVATTTDRAVAAVVRHLRAIGWQILEANANIGIVEAIAHTYVRNGLPGHERWSFFVQPNAIRTWRYDETASRPDGVGLWSRRYETRSSYDYFAEREHLEAIAATLREEPAVVAATR